MYPDSRLSSPAVARNRAPILDVLAPALREAASACGSDRLRLLELASGSGEHALYFSQALPWVDWQPSDPSTEAVASVRAWRAAEGPANLAEPLTLDVTRRPWPLESIDALVAINLVHISPWAVTEALMAEAGVRLPSGGLLFLYGPYRRDGQHTAPSNEAFDASLRTRDPRWGIRDLEAVLACARSEGLALEKVVEMPANNLSVVLRKP
ncbi:MULTISPECIES: DUF938 domain-containing protein [Halomonadaceae]|jgi:hypothetical protein|uniref:DUF938 domain-containing protein n=1 Tax=Halomonadaceae TaxID=28256 RepID=UPI001C2E97EA|nr:MULTISPECIES: DUF938 domain-containing protein [Halomonas]MDI4636861.1 class I SAM-dependent methyltransferase [Halomonas sp. BMC7]